MTCNICIISSLACCIIFVKLSASSWELMWGIFARTVYSCGLSDTTLIPMLNGLAPASTVSTNHQKQAQDASCSYLLASQISKSGMYAKLTIQMGQCINSVYISCTTSGKHLVWGRWVYLYLLGFQAFASWAPARCLQCSQCLHLWLEILHSGRNQAGYDDRLLLVLPRCSTWSKAPCQHAGSSHGL